jgi:glycosyltransferase involved in cell wall biosynthesis
MTRDIHYEEIFDLDIRVHYLIRKSKKDMSIFQKFYKICRKYKPDIVHCWDSMTAIYSAPICRLLNIKFVNGMVVDTPMPQNMSNVHWRRARVTFPLSNIIIGNSKAGLAGYRAPARKSACIHNGMDLRRFAKVKDPSLMKKELLGNDAEDLFIIGMVAQFDIERKDFGTLIEAAQSLLLIYSNLRFIVVGEGPDFDKVKNSIPDLISDKIKLTGRRSDVESIVNIFDVGVLLTNIKLHGEGISNAIIEYMALAKPVVASRGGGTDEIVEDKKNGFLISPFSVEELSEKLQILINDAGLRQQMGSAGKERIQKCFTIDKMVNKFISIYT